MRDKTYFRIFYLLMLVSVCCLFSCRRPVSVPEGLDDNFLPGTTEGLYRTKDLKMVLDESAAKLPKDSKSNKQLITLSQKENLYKNNRKANVFNLRDLLKIRTVKSGGKKVKISSGLDNIYIDPEIPFLNEYEILDYSFSAPTHETEQQKITKKLLGNIREFKGFPDTEYYILPHFLGDYLILYKLAPPDKIPYNEIPLAKRIGDMLAVPLVGYPVEYCQAVKVLDSNNLKETLKVRPLCKGIQPKQPTKYIRLWEHKKQVFQYLEKLNFFHKKFFAGQWLYFQTLVRAPTERGGEIFETSRIVNFHSALGKMDVMEVHDLKKDDEKRVLFIPVKWTDYEIARDAEHLDRSFSERLKKVNETHRPYLEIKFNELINNEFQYGGSKTLKSVIITKDYISFDIEITTKGFPAYLIKYAFKRYVKSGTYVEKRWFKSDNLLFFPLLKVERKYYEDSADHTLLDRNRFQRVVRFNPKSKEIRWYFSEHTPKSEKNAWVRSLGFKAVDLLNKALEEAGRDSKHKIKIILDDSEDKEVGDIRYNILNLILSESDTPEQLRWGANVANPITGEVVSATATVWLTRVLSDYISLIRRYIRFHVYPPAWKMKPFSPDTAQFIYENVNKNKLQCSELSREPLGVTPFFHEKINNVCEEVSNFIKANKGGEFHPKDTSLNDDKIVKSCAYKMARVKILQSILKSMLHSLGLENMKSASADKKHFYHKDKNRDEIKELFGQTSPEAITASHNDFPQYSSVTDQMDLEYPTLAVPGKLDIAALRFIYFDKVDLLKDRCLKSGMLHVPSGADADPNNPQKSIFETAQREGCKREDIKNYNICGSNNKANTPVICSQNSYGTNPLEIVVNNICKLHNELLSSRNRYDGRDIVLDRDPYIGAKLVSGAGAWSRADYDRIHDISAIYSKWKKYRNNILKGRGETIKDYSFFNPKDIEKYEQVMKIAESSPDGKPYYLIRRPIFDYVKRLNFAPTKHCIYRELSDADNTFRYKAIALENIEDEILHEYQEYSDQERKVFMSCSSPIVKNWIKGELVAEVGFFLNERKYFIRPRKTDDPDEQMAFKKIEAFTSRFSDAIREPEFGIEYYQEWLSYITQGVDLNPYIDGKTIKSPLERVLTYKMDTRDVSIDTYIESLWEVRRQPLENFKTGLGTHVKSLTFMQTNFSHLAFSITELKRIAASFEKNPGLHSREIPFIVQASNAYKTKTEEEKQQLPFIKYIINHLQTHPAVLYHPEDSVYVLPYIDDEMNFPSRLFRQYNSFFKCIDGYNTDGKKCNNMEEKSTFIEFVLNNYDSFLDF